MKIPLGTDVEVSPRYINNPLLIEANNPTWDIMLLW